MRRRVKRRMFLMGLAMAAGAMGHAHAKGGQSGQDGQAFPGGPAGPMSSRLPFDQARGIVSIPEGLLSRFWARLQDFDYDVAGDPSLARRPRLGLHLFQPDAASGLSDDPRLNGKQVGMALRISF